MNRVKNQFPSLPPTSSRICIIGQSPGDQEAYYGAPFVGESGKFLDSALGHVGLVRAQCFVGNVCQVQSPKNRFDAFEWDGAEIQSGIRQLQDDLTKFNPTMVLCLGNEALHLFRHGNTTPPKKGGQYDWPDKVSDWRGSLFVSRWLDGVKCLATYHPAAVLREFSWQQYVRFDLQRLRDECRTPELVLPKRKIGVVGQNHPLAWGLSTLEVFRRESKPVALDIEGRPGNITCIAFSRRADSALVFPLAHCDGTSVWSEADELAIWQAVKELVEDPGVEKIAQNGQYDFFCLAWTYNIVVRNWKHDTMLSWWELYPELDKGLDVQASILTKEPFYKPDKEEGELKFASDEEFWRYNGVDAAVTFEVWEKALALMSPGQRVHYDWNVKLLNPVLYMMLKGIRWDKTRAREEKKKMQAEAWKLQDEVNRVAVGVGWKTGEMLEKLWLTMETRDEALFSEVVVATLCKKLVKRREEVTVERWQPMRWNGKKWVKDGKMVEELPEPHPMIYVGPENRANLVHYLGWFKPVPKTVSKLTTFIPHTLKDCEDFVLESKKKEWRSVKRVWKGLRNDDGHDGRNDGLARQRADKRHEDSRNSVGGDLYEGGESVARDARNASTDSCEVVSNGQRAARAASRGHLSILLNLAVNVGSSSAEGDAPRFLYEVCKLPRIYVNERKQFSRESDTDWKKRLRGESVSFPQGKRATTAKNALNKLYAETKDVRALMCAQLRKLKKSITDLEVEVDADSRLRASISLVKETGRMAESKSPSGTGMNRQSLNKHLRRVCVADEGCDLYQCDLEGADSWTVAAECAALGDSTMLEDLRAGLKPAKIICLLYLQGDEVNKLSREELKQRLKDVEMPAWLYPGAKSTCHGSSYGAAWKTVIDTILKYSMADLPLVLTDAKPIVLSKDQVEKLQGAFFTRYPGVRDWHKKMARVIMETGRLETSVGHVRKLFGRKKEIKKGQVVVCHDTLKEALASLPQFYTTHASKKAALRLWYDPLNRREDGSLRVEPLLLVHDSLLAQARREEKPFACSKMRAWFDDAVSIAGVDVVIPAEGTVGSDWGMGEAEAL